MKNALTVAQSPTKIIHVIHGFVKDMLKSVQLKTVQIENSVKELTMKMTAVTETIAAGSNTLVLRCMCRGVTKR